VDFDDLIRLAIPDAGIPPTSFSNDCAIAGPYILEDEAQDSSQLAEDILRLPISASRQLGPSRRSQPGHFETFTTATQVAQQFIKTGPIHRWTSPIPDEASQPSSSSPLFD